MFVDRRRKGEDVAVADFRQSVFGQLKVIKRRRALGATGKGDAAVLCHGGSDFR